MTTERRGIVRSAVLVAGLGLIAACAAPNTELDARSQELPEDLTPEERLDALDGSLYVNGSGGTLFDVWSDTWWRPYTEQTGVDVEESSPADLSRLRAQVESGNVEWDLTEIETGGQYLEAANQGLLTELQPEVFRDYFEAFGGDWDDMMPGALGSHGLRHAPYAIVLLYDKEAFPDGGPQPTSVSDLWNVDQFPGKRCVQEQAMFILESALVADGVARDDLYPLDIDRALRKMDELAPHIATFWRSGAESIQLVADGECAISTAWNGRPFAAKVEEGIDDIGLAWEDGILVNSYWVIPNGAQNLEAAYALLAMYQLPEVGAANANRVGYGNTNTATNALISDEARPYVATSSENLDVLIEQNEEWWYENGAEAEERFSEWRLNR